MKRVLRTPFISLFGFVLMMCFGLFHVAVAAPGDILFSDNFETGLGQWTRSSNQHAGISTQTANSGSRSLFTCCGAVDVTSDPVDLSATPAAELSMWIRIGDDINANFSEWPDSAGEDLVIQYFDSASGWVALETFVGGAHTAGAIYNRTYTLPTSAMHANFQIRVSQTGGSGNNFDYYHVDDVILTEVAPPPPVALGSCDDFESGLTNWSITTISGTAAIAAGVNTVNSPTHALYLANGQVYVTSAAIDTSSAATPYLSLWVRRGQDNLDGFSEYPENGENLQIQYLDSGNNWVTLDTLPGGGLAGEILNLSYALPAAAIHANFQVRLYMTNGSGVGWDYWHVDDVCVGDSSAGALVAYYAQDESSWNGTSGEVADGSGNGLHGTAMNGLSTATAKVCRGGNFNGVNGPVEIADNALLDISDELTVSAWIQPNAIPGSGLKTILSKDENYEFHINTAGEIYWWWNDSNGNVRSLATSGANLIAGNWYHVAITYRSGQQRIYVNAIPLASSSYSGTLLTNADPLHIGGDQGYAGRQFDGLIDEVRVYATEQSQAQVNADMLATHPCPVTPVALYHLDESAWGIVVDSSGGSNDGSTVGTVTASSASPAIAGDPGTCGYADVPNNNTTTPMDAIDSGIDIDTQVGNQGTISFWYKSNTIWDGGNDRQLFDASNSTTRKYFQLMLDNRGRLRFELEDSADANHSVRTNRLNIAANTWTHVAVTWDLTADQLEIYVNGALSNSNNINSTGAIGDLDTLYIGDNRSNYLAGNATRRSADGSFDEIRIYNLVQTTAQIAADMNATHACMANQVHHYRILHDGSALTCNSETVTVQACMDAGCTSFYNSTVSATLDPTGDALSITDGSGIASIAIRNNTAGAITLGLSGATPAATNATECLNTSDNSASCVLTFHDSGFVFDVPDTTSCAAETNITISAVRKDLTSQTCVPAFSNRTATLKFWSDYVSPATGTNTVNVNGTNVSTSAPGTNISLNFNASGVSTIDVTYPDAGQMQLNARFDGAVGTEEEGLVMIGNDNFVAVPAKFIVASGDVNADCATGDATCSAFNRAGEAFNLTVSAACANDATTPNFIANGITLGHNLIAPAAGSAGTLGNGSIDIAAADSGSATINNQSIDEVGVFTINAALDSYLGVTATPGNHLIEGVSNNIGRFIPARLFVTANAPVFDNACILGANPYTYLDQDFGYSGNPVITVTAQNTAGGFTRNYGGPFWKLNTALSNRAYTNNVAAIPGFARTTDGGDATLLGDNFDPVPPTLTINGDRFTYNRTVAPISARNADVDLDLTAADLTDSDGVCFDPANAVCNAGGAGTATGITISSITGAALRYGIGIATDALEPSTALGTTLTLPITAQYVDATGTVVTNTDDVCSSVGYSKVDTGINTSVTPTPSPVIFNSGSGDLTITLTADTGGDTGGYSVFTLTWPAWLPGTPNATAIFGAIPSDNNYLYWNENR